MRISQVSDAARRRINPKGFVVGYAGNEYQATPGFIRSPGGHISTFQAPGGGDISGGTTGESINPSGVIAGYFIDTSTFSTATFCHRNPVRSTCR